MEFDRSRELDGHPDLMSLAPEQGDDIQTVEMMLEVAELDAAAASGDLSTDELEGCIDELNHRWQRYKGLTAIVADADMINPAVGKFEGFMIGLVADGESIRWAVSYEFIDPSDNSKFHANSAAHLEFPEVISQRKLEMLAEPIMESIDVVLGDERAESIEFVLNQLRDLSLYRNVSPHDFQYLYFTVAEYLNYVSGIREVIALDAEIRGDTYDSKNLEAIPSSGFVRLTDTSFFIKQPVPGVPELSLKATMAQRGDRLTVVERIIPLDVMHNIRKVA